MSGTNADRLIEVNEAFNRLTNAPDAFDPEALQAFLGAMDPEIRFEPQQAALEGGYVGREGVVQWLADLAQHYANGNLHLVDVRDLGDRVLALGTLHFVARGSGIETEAPVAIVASFRDGLITDFKDYGAGGEALEAVELVE